MELFVVNRHNEEPESKGTEVDEEQEKLKKTLQRIEKNKKLRSKQKERDKKLKETIQRTTKLRQAKRELKAKIVVVPKDDNKEFLDHNIEVDEANNAGTTEENTAKNRKNKKRKLDSNNVEGFTILGVDNFAKKNKVKRVLPKWLANPTIISVNLQKLETKVSDMKVLDKSLRKLLKAKGILNFFPVQVEVIPWLLESNRHSDIMFPRDVCISAPTGSGKTLAFVLPLIQVIKKHHIKKIRALVILPTRDLAVQVFTTFKTYSEGTNIDICLITGQNSFEAEQRQLVYKNAAFGYVTKVDILVCTAGRLIDHLKATEGFDLQHLEFLVIDEADRVLESVQNDWLYHLEKHIYPDGSTRILNQITLQKRRPPQKLLFSATLSQDPEKLQQLNLFQPKLFTSVVENNGELSKENLVTVDKFIGKYTTPKELTERYIQTSVDLKPLVLYKFINQEKLRKILVFTHSVESAHRLAILLTALFKEELKVQDISSHLQLKQRKELITKFSEGQIDILISTDALARGIDLPGVQCVISYSAPKYLKAYIHRAGRTARAGEQGIAITMLHSSQLPKFQALLKQAEKSNVEEIKISEEDLEPLGDQYKESLDKLRNTVEKEEKTGLKKIKAAKKFKKNIKSYNAMKINSNGAEKGTP
ncbi:hypothetical protein ABEB36_002280 [Hypothenemus hampei]|uniref:ATP-dependent RNA helicase n=1 Tax=Hypothenemus hampei TaxID=57062 RepID=A0ABD1F592_HYPHA